MDHSCPQKVSEFINAVATTPGEKWTPEIRVASAQMSRCTLKPECLCLKKVHELRSSNVPGLVGHPTARSASG